MKFGTVFVVPRSVFLGLLLSRAFVDIIGFAGTKP